MEKILIIGAGPAGLTAAYELLKNNKTRQVIIVEQSDQIGGISKTASYKGNRIDLGGHRFFSKDSQINKMWLELLPLQGFVIDQTVEEPQKIIYDGKADPNNTDEVMLQRRRISRIYFNNKFFDYPISVNLNTIKNLGIFRAMYCGCGYIFSSIFKRSGTSLEDFYINRFGKPLYRFFFEDYTTKLWGVSPKELDSSWGEQRIKKLSLFKILKDGFLKIFKDDYKTDNTSLIEEFYYPKFGPGQLWEKMRDRIEQMGGAFIYNATCTKVLCDDRKINSVTITFNDDSTRQIECDYLLSSMPVKDIISCMNDVPERVSKISQQLPYRDFVTVGILVNKLEIVNTTDIKTKNNIPPDCWIYIQDRSVKMGRIQIFNNWSPYLVEDSRNNVWMGLEYFCSEGDEFWRKTDDDIKQLAKKEIVKIGIVDSENIIDCVVLRQKKAYPAYYGEYKNFDVVKNHLLKYRNLICIGRNGQHRYNNMDHSMMTGILASKVIEGETDAEKVWSVNTEKVYHEKRTEKV